MPTPSIFISHSHFDNVFCRRLHDFLQQQLPHAGIFFDESELHGGDEWMGRIQRQVIECPLFVVVLSSHSVAAQWVREETNLALSRAVTDKQRRVIPVQVDPRIEMHDIDQLAPLLTTRQIIDLSDDALTSHWDDLVRVLRGEVSDVSTRSDVARTAELQRAVEYATLAHEAFAAGRWRDALVQAQEAVKWPGSERDTTLWVEMAEAYERLNRLPEAIQALDSALAINRQREDLWRQKAHLLLRLQPAKIQEAHDAFQSALAHTRALPSKLGLVLEEFEALRMAGDVSGALDACEYALELVKEDNDWQLRKFELLQQTGDTQGALALSEQALEIMPEDRDWLERKLEALVALGKSMGALETARKLTARSDATSAEWFTRARLARAVAGDSADDEVRVSLAAAAQLSPHDPTIAKVRVELFTPDLSPEQFPERLASLGYTAKREGVIFLLPPLCSVHAGEFLFGSDKRQDTGAFDDELPQHGLTLPAFQLARFPVTVAEYACFVRSGQKEPNAWLTQLGRLDHPVVYVSWHDAVAYAAWLATTTGQPWRLPSEAEWEKAARWDAERRVARIYPWSGPFDKARCNTAESGIRTTTPVGSYPSGASPYNVLELTGNVWEWTNSLKKPYPYTASDGRETLNSLDNRVLRGGSWNLNARNARAACRSNLGPGEVSGSIGFRIALTPVDSNA